MRVHDGIEKCVAFVMVDAEKEETGKVGRIPGGTCFFVGVSVDGLGTNVYAVTARHVIDSVKRYGKGYLRVNRVGGGFVDHSFEPDKCLEHRSRDVALVSVSIQDGFDLRWIPMASTANAERMLDDKIGVGDEVFVVRQSEEGFLARLHQVVAHEREVDGHGQRHDHPHEQHPHRRRLQQRLQPVRFVCRW